MRLAAAAAAEKEAIKAAIAQCAATEVTVLAAPYRVLRGLILLESN